MATQRRKLVYRKRTFYFHLVIQKDIEPRKVDKFIGVDSGFNNLAVLFTGLLFKGEEIKAKRIHFMSKRKELMIKGTRSAKRRLLAMSGREKRFVFSSLHKISRKIVKEAIKENAGIVLDHLYP